MLLESFAHNWQKAQSTNSTATSFSALIPTLTKPEASATRSVFALPREGLRQGNTIKVMPYGGNTDNDIIIQRVVGWNRIKGTGASANPNGMWIPQHVCTVTATLSSTLLGIANEAVVATEFLADTLALTNGIAVLYQGTVANQEPAWFSADVSGFELVEITYDLSTGGDTQNALVRFDI